MKEEQKKPEPAEIKPNAFGVKMKPPRLS